MNNRNITTAKSFISKDDALNNADSLIVYLASEGVTTSVPKLFDSVVAIQYIKYLPQEIERRLHKLGWSDWNYNPCILVYF